MIALSERLIEVLLPRGGYVMNLYDAYFDESGCDDGSRLLAVGGYLLRSDRAKVMDRKWKAVLDKYDLPYFHMVDCAPGNKPFDHLTKPQRIKVARLMIHLIKSFTALGFVSVLNPKRFEQRSELRDADPYSFCVNMCMMALCVWLADKGPSKVAFFIEAGHENSSKAGEEISHWAKGEDGRQYYGAHAFASKEEVRLLQAADLLVWQSAKFMKEKMFGRRPPRRDFLSLMKHPHAFAYVALHNDVLAWSIDNMPHAKDSFRDTYLGAMFSDSPISDDIVNQYHQMIHGRGLHGKLEL